MKVASVQVTGEKWLLREPFRFSGFAVEALDTVHVVVADGLHRGQGEGVVPVVFDSTLQQALVTLEGARAEILTGQDAWTVCAGLPAGAARNALDCALWDLQVKTSCRNIWDLAGLGQAATSLPVDQSIGLGDPDAMAKIAAASQHDVLKIKLDNMQVTERIEAIRSARPDATIIVDVNQAWTTADLVRHAPVLAELGVSMIEQPLRVGLDHELADLHLPVPVYADESCHTRADLVRLAPFYDGINIKLDKSGGLTEALALAKAATDMGVGLMVGCMAGTSLSMAPAFVVASLCNWADLDGPLLLASDRASPMNYRGGKLECFTPALWG
jgi:L-alanine-DL-glutamate epimerase-like enolase superfamily enzyme